MRQCRGSPLVTVAQSDKEMAVTDTQANNIGDHSSD